MYVSGGWRSCEDKIKGDDDKERIRWDGEVIGIIKGRGN